jgi:flagellar protein FlaG
MLNHAKITPVTASPIRPSSAAAGGDFSDSRARQDADEAARYRLVIEEGPSAGSFIYKTLDRVTGEVVRQLPREQVVDLMRAGSYSAGTVIDTRA